MTIITIKISRELANKPELGEKCNSCGWCCTQAKCAPSIALFGFRHDGRCKLLNKDNKCTILTGEAITHFSKKEQRRIIQITKKVNGVGKGCDAFGTFEAMSIEKAQWLKEVRTEFYDSGYLLDELRAIKKAYKKAPLA